VSVTKSNTCNVFQLIGWHSTINLTKNSQFYVRQGDVERLIVQGYLQRLS
jgi:hypothetical protein